MMAGRDHNIDQTAAHRLARLAELFNSAAMAEPYGEDLSIRDHMLQAAELAVAQGLGDTMVIAALLHDIGWAVAGPDAASDHHTVAADLLAPLFGPEIADLVRHHVAAKRYLVASQPDYAACLSQASRHTLALQGGPMSAAEQASFAAEPGFASALELRHLDDAAKDERAPATDFATYAPMLRRGLLRNLLDG